MTRATDLPIEARAFLDALAVGESGGKDDDTAYSELFGGGHFQLVPSALSSDGSGYALALLTRKQSFPAIGYPVERWPTAFPSWNGVWINGVPTHAAGRYQFEPATWREQQTRLSLPDFSPASQDHAAWDLACRAMREDILPILQADLPDFMSIVGHLRSTWTSLSPDTFPDRYRAALARYQGAGG